MFAASSFVNSGAKFCSNRTLSLVSNSGSRRSTTCNSRAHPARLLVNNTEQGNRQPFLQEFHFFAVVKDQQAWNWFLPGFVAWLREYGELYENSPIHIHAIAVGDKELSPAAQGQLTGFAGYFRGFSGLVDAKGHPTLDRYGGPILCQWMIDLGYRDLR